MNSNYDIPLVFLRNMELTPVSNITIKLHEDDQTSKKVSYYNIFNGTQTGFKFWTPSMYVPFGLEEDGNYVLK